MAHQATVAGPRATRARLERGNHDRDRGRIRRARRNAVAGEHAASEVLAPCEMRSKKEKKNSMREMGTRTRTKNKDCGGETTDR